MSIKWTKVGKTVGAEGTTIVYASKEAPFLIESRKRHIPHANGSGFWDHTTYYVIDPQRCVEREFWSLGDAKEFVEKARGGMTWPTR